jgi:hypothetical protein
MKSLTNLWQNPKFWCLNLQLKYQLMSTKRRVIYTLYEYSHIRVCEPIPIENIKIISGRKLMPISVTCVKHT